jgi:hypothetical protein
MFFVFIDFSDRFAMVYQSICSSKAGAPDFSPAAFDLAPFSSGFAGQ